MSLGGMAKGSSDRSRRGASEPGRGRGSPAFATGRKRAKNVSQLRGRADRSFGKPDRVLAVQHAEPPLREVEIEACRPSRCAVGIIAAARLVDGRRGACARRPAPLSGLSWRRHGRGEAGFHQPR